MSKNLVDELFNPGTQVEDNTKKNNKEYKPSANKGSNNVYQAVIRFVPWWKDPKNGSIKDKWVSWLIDPVTQKGRFVDCPSSIGKPSPLQDMFWKLKKSESVQDQKLADTFSRKHTFTALVQVIKDKNQPELEGKILVWRFGIKIYQKIESELKPVVGDPHDPFDLIKGKAFALKITKVKGFNNYDQSSFIDKKIPLCIPDENGKLQTINENSNKKEVFEWVKENSPQLDKYGYKEWDQEIFDYVNHIITSVTGQTNVTQQYSNIVNESKSGSSESQHSNISNNNPTDSGSSNDSSLDDMNVKDVDINLSDDDIGTDDLPDLDGLDGNDDDSKSNDSGLDDLDDIIDNS